MKPDVMHVDDEIEFRRKSLSAEEARIVHPERLKRALRGSSVGNIIEWYEFGVFGFLITIMGPVFLPDSDPTVQSLYLFGTFAVTFVARPIGGVFFGWLGDRIGRRKVLTITLTMMSAVTFAIGLIPGYAVIGIWAPLLLVLMRLFQGFAASGEYTGAATFLSEFAPDQERGRYTGILASMIYIGFAFGAGLVTVLQLIFSAEFMHDWGWRIPFLLALPLTGIAVYIRLRVEESPAFAAVMRDRAELQEKQQQVSTNKNVWQVIRSRWRSLLPAVGIAAAGNVVAYTMFSYLPTYLSQNLGFESATSTLILFSVYVLAIFVTMFGGRMSDKYGRKPVLITASLIGIVLSVPAFLLMETGLVIFALLGLLPIMVTSAFFSQSYSSTLPEQFPTEDRNTALGLSYNVGNALLGGTAPFVLGALIAATGILMMPAYYLVGAAILGLISALSLKETSRRPLQGSVPNVRTQEEAEELADKLNANHQTWDGSPGPFSAFRPGTDDALDPNEPHVMRAARDIDIVLER